MPSQALINTIRQSIIGDLHPITTAFGHKPLVYADYTASGRSLGFIEDFIAQQVLPFYANTHTETSYSGAQTSALRDQARQQIRQSLGASDQHQVIFCGSGATAAIHKLIDILNLRLPADLDARYQLRQQINEAELPVVFIGPYEHHSNELPWRESIAKLVVIPLDENGQLDCIVLEQQLQKHQLRALKIASFSAASNVTGLKTAVDAVSRLLHRYDVLCCWDYAAAGPYVGINVSGPIDERGDSSKDAIFISPHKFIGGPGTPGILVVNNKLLNNKVPTVAGGGTVVYVSPQHHRYTDNRERREEAGTPAIIESIRAGLVFKLQAQVGAVEIERREHRLISRAIARLGQHGNIRILGNVDAPRLSILSFCIKHEGKDLHYGFVVALLNDLFGIQVRGGCSCAGPYGHHLLAMDSQYSRALESQVVKGNMLLRPGWVRLNFNYFIDENTFEYLLRAIELVAQYGWRLLPFYHVDKKTGLWRYQNITTALASSLLDLDFTKLPLAKRPPAKSRERQHSLNHYLSLAEQELRLEGRAAQKYSLQLDANAEALRWFALPQDVSLAELT